MESYGEPQLPLHAKPSTSDFSYSTLKKPSDPEGFNCTKYQKISDSGSKTQKSYTPSSDYSKPSKKCLKRWTAAEDQNLLDLYYKIGNGWEQIAVHMNGRAPSAVKNRFYWLCNSKLPVQTINKIKNVCKVKKLYKSPVNSSELYRKINNYLREEVIFQNFLDLDMPEPYSQLVHKLKINPQNVENHAKMQKLIEQAQLLYKHCEQAKAGLANVERELVTASGTYK